MKANMITVEVKELKNNFEKYLQYVQNGQDIIILRNKKEVAKLIPHEKCESSITDSLIGILKSDYDKESIKKERMKKYETFDSY